MSWRSLQAQNLTCLFALTYWPSWLISPLTIHELLHLSKETREALRDALANSESFLTHMLEIPRGDTQPSCSECHHVQSKIHATTFTTEDMLLKDNNHDRSLYYIGYIDSTCLKGYRLIQGLHLASFPKGFSTSLAYHCIGCLQPLWWYTILM